MEEEVDRNKAMRIIGRILKEENTNIKTKENNDDSMKKIIDKIIEEEVKCY
ncbi:MAG: hypothetical protein IJ880_09340 [Bacilli bacterium]|nr:hypothetical protein [Bacilli bacterium]